MISNVTAITMNTSPAIPVQMYTYGQSHCRSSFRVVFIPPIIVGIRIFNTCCTYQASTLMHFDFRKQKVDYYHVW